MLARESTRAEHGYLPVQVGLKVSGGGSGEPGQVMLETRELRQILLTQKVHYYEAVLVEILP